VSSTQEGERNCVLFR